MRQRRVLVVLVVGMMLIAGRARTPAATPLATPLAPHCPPGWRFGQGGACVLPPCNPRAVALTSGRVAARLDRTPEDLIVRLQPIPLAPSLSALSLGRDSVAWAVPSWAQAGSHVSQPARLYLADLRYFRPTLVAQSCAGFADVRLSARWLVWSQPVFLGLNRPGTSRIWVLDLHTGRRSLVNADAFPARSVYDEGSLSLGDDAVTWARGLGIQPHTNFVARMAIVTRRLPDRPITSLVPAAAVNLDNAGAPHLQSISDPQRSGNLLVWARARWTGRGPSTDLLMMNLSTGLQRVVASGGAAYPVTNGRKIAWDGP
ncbi:MAG: hypothetical protein JOZ41_10960, partial [Chloroflexi bacterium]|nr:hypothetical protein [Chloroflexota bacterium]